MMRLCRVCLAHDLTNSFENCFDDNGLIAKEIASLFDILIVEISDAPALICRKCKKHVLQASELKKLCKKSSDFFRKILVNERYMLHENLRELKALTSTVGSNSCEALPILSCEHNQEEKEVLATNNEEKFEEEEKIIEEPSLEEKMIVDQNDNEEFCKLAESDLEEFIKEADRQLLSTLEEIDNLDEQNSCVTPSTKAESSCVIENKTTQKPQPKRRMSVRFAKKVEAIPTPEPCAEPSPQPSSEPSPELSSEQPLPDDILDDLVNTINEITFEQIMEMTEVISNVLPQDNEPKLKKKKKVKTRKNIPRLKIVIKEKKATVKEQRVPVVKEIYKSGPKVVQKIHDSKIKSPKMKCEICRLVFDDKKALVKHVQKKHNPFGRGTRHNQRWKTVVS